MRLSQPTETVRVPVSSRPIVCAVVGGTQRCATSSSVSPLARRTSRIAVIIGTTPNRFGFFSFLQTGLDGKRK
jgi:hypothetical protein